MNRFLRIIGAVVLLLLLYGALVYSGLTPNPADF